MHVLHGKRSRGGSGASVSGTHAPLDAVRDLFLLCSGNGFFQVLVFLALLPTNFLKGNKQFFGFGQFFVLYICNAQVFMRTTVLRVNSEGLFVVEYGF